MITPPTWQLSPNFGERLGVQAPDMVIIHYTAMKSARAAVDWLCNPQAEVSAHYLVTAEGAVTQMVDEGHRAWHAGQAQWGDITDINSHSIGIELDNTGLSPFAAPQMDALETLLRDILDRHGIRPARVLGHADVSLGRKIDPGPRFDWRRLARHGLSVWPNIAASPRPRDDFFTDAARHGYCVQGKEQALIAAFRSRFRPWAKGPLDDVDAGMMADLAARFPVDRTGAGA